MSISMYKATVPVFISMLTNLSTILKKADHYAESKKIDPSALINARLAPDMFPFARQIQIATDAAKGCAARLANLEIPSFPDTETTFSQLDERLTKTINFLKTVNASQIDGSEERSITLKVAGQELQFKGQEFTLHFALPNFYFHISMAYAILRHNGLDIGKKDYLGSL
ncbi:DUF1993 family protein [Legionella sp. km772]|uniref:DUF1993 domain-containing protein n=1 Tax=Legionella sp. km772 TaxID=2498111 RepID=UPI000F8E3602|nr:DUF1993 domain-containing protein [Legionella sp. km772]RUR05031.1 DUF1993 domain-containing protein [Legionella sp. km772]